MAKKKVKQLSGKTLTNSRGNEVDISLINKAQLKKHKLVRSIYSDMAMLQIQMRKKKKAVMKKIDDYRQWLLKQNKIEDAAVLLNLQLSDYSSLTRVDYSSSKVIDFDERLQIAEAKIKGCIRSWGKGAHPALQVIVDQVFRTDKKGFVNKNAILGLFQYRIEEKEWKEAMDLIRDSMKEVDRKAYLRVQFRADAKEDWNTIDLNFSSLEAE